jgi:hypothetical protein
VGSLLAKLRSDLSGFVELLNSHGVEYAWSVVMPSRFMAIRGSRRRWIASVSFVLLALGAFSCSRPPEPRSETSERRNSNALQGRSAARPVRAGLPGGTDVGGQPGAPAAAQEPGIGAHERDHERRVVDPYFILEVTGPSEAFRKRATKPTDSEVFYLEESVNSLGDGRRVETAVATSKAAVRRFKAAARKLGFEVRSHAVGESNRPTSNP